MIGLGMKLLGSKIYFKFAILLFHSLSLSLPQIMCIFTLEFIFNWNDFSLSYSQFVWRMEIIKSIIALKFVTPIFYVIKSKKENKKWGKIKFV